MPWRGRSRWSSARKSEANAELRRCHQLASIPGEPAACLNLAQAFTILAYEWRLAQDLAGIPATALAAESGIADLAGLLAEILTIHHLLKPRERESKVHTLRRMLSRARLAPDESALLAGWLQALTRRP